jgi:His-Xaa-Ser system protein HxsD
MRRTHLMRPMLPVDTKPSVPAVEATADFDATIQSLGALEAAAYRLIGAATCRIERRESRFVCLLVARSGPSRLGKVTADELKLKFLDLVTDENLRARIAEKTDGLRNVILALAFGSLAASQHDAD